MRASILQSLLWPKHLFSSHLRRSCLLMIASSVSLFRLLIPSESSLSLPDSSDWTQTRNNNYSRNTHMLLIWGWWNQFILAQKHIDKDYLSVSFFTLKFKPKNIFRNDTQELGVILKIKRECVWWGEEVDCVWVGGWGGVCVHTSCTTRAWIQDFQLTGTIFSRVYTLSLTCFHCKTSSFFSFSFFPSDLILEEAGVKEKCFSAERR